MIRRLIILLLIVGCVFAQNIDTSEMNQSEKLLLYQEDKKSPFLAGLLAIITPTLGHLYIGDQTRGFRPQSLSFGGIFALSSSIYCYNYTVGGKWVMIGDEYIENYLLPISIPLLASWYIFQYKDAIYFAKEHNAELFTKIYGEEMTIQYKKSFVQRIIDKK